MLKRIALLSGLALLLLTTSARAEVSFSFERYPSLDAMRIYIEKELPLGTARESLRKAFVEQGKATLKENPARPGVEKYIYDIDICGRYVFRWNISADYDEAGKLKQAYVNGRFVFMEGTPPRTLKFFETGGKLKRVQTDRPRPQMTGKRNFIRYRMFDTDGNMETTDDRMAEGEGPPAAELYSLSKMVFYRDVELWRSIFDPDDADKVVPYAGCKGPPPRDALFDALLGPELDKLKTDFEKTQADIKAGKAAP